MGVRLGDVVYQPSTGRPAVDGAGRAGYISATKRGLCGGPAGGAAGGGRGSHGFGAAIAAADKGGARPTGGTAGAGSSGGAGSAGQGRREVGAGGWWGCSRGAISGGIGGGIGGLVGSVGGAGSFAGGRGGDGAGGARAATGSFAFVFVTAFFVAAIGGGI